MASKAHRYECVIDAGVARHRLCGERWQEGVNTEGSCTRPWNLWINKSCSTEDRVEDGTLGSG
jgi:hypothetical protein